tara:strand:+ start:876 stop:1043 length:168 start_codon:yes stop_codon:yes gene_type:complete
LSNKYKIPDYIKILIGDNPRIISGRKNFYYYEKRVAKTLDLIKKYTSSKKYKKNN